MARAEGAATPANKGVALVNSLTRSLVVEFVGPFTLMFAGGAAIIQTGGKDLVAIALAHGLAIGLMIAAAGHISGGVYNPAISVGLIATGKLPPVKGLLYCVVQLLGGLVAALLLRAFFPAGPADAVNLGTPALGQGVTPTQGLLIEIVLTFFLQFVIFGTAIDKRGPATIAGLAIGLTITMDVVAAGNLTGAVMNPARALGPAIVSGQWTDQWVWWVGPVLGALGAAALYNFVLLEPVAEREPSMELPQSPVARHQPPRGKRRR